MLKMYQLNIFRKYLVFRVTSSNARRLLSCLTHMFTNPTTPTSTLWLHSLLTTAVLLRRRRRRCRRYCLAFYACARIFNWNKPSLLSSDIKLLKYNNMILYQKTVLLQSLATVPIVFINYCFIPKLVAILLLFTWSIYVRRNLSYLQFLFQPQDHTLCFLVNY